MFERIQIQDSRFTLIYPWEGPSKISNGFFSEKGAGGTQIDDSKKNLWRGRGIAPQFRHFFTKKKKFGKKNYFLDLSVDF